MKDWTNEQQRKYRSYRMEREDQNVRGSCDKIKRVKILVKKLSS